VIFRAQKYPLGKDLDLQGLLVHSWNDLYKSHVNIVGARAISRFGPVYVGSSLLPTSAHA